MGHEQTIAMARGLLADGRAADVGRMLEPLISPLHETVPGAVDADQLALRCLLARVRLLHYGDPAQAYALLKPFTTSSAREALPPAARADVALWLGWTHAWSYLSTYDAARALHLFDEADQFAQDALHTMVRCWVLLGRALAWFSLHEYPLMQQAVHEAASLQAGLHDAQATTWMLDFRILACETQGRFAQALTCVEALKKHAPGLDDTFAQARASTYEATLFTATGRSPDLIAETARNARRLLRRAATEPGWALLTAYRAHLTADIRRGAWDQAETLIDEALQATTNQPTASLQFMLYRIHLAVARGQHEQAAAWLQDVQAQLRKHQHRLLAADLALAWSDLHIHREAFDAARAWADQAYQQARAIGHEPRQLSALLAVVQSSLEDQETAHHLLARTAPYDHLFTILPFAAQRFTVLGLKALAEQNPEEAQAHFTQAFSSYSLVDDVYRAAQVQVMLARVEHEQRPHQARNRLLSALQTFERLGAHTDRASAQSLLAGWPADADVQPDTADVMPGAALARAALSVPLVAETWLQAVARLLPDRWLGLYRCDDGRPWQCVRETGDAPTVPNFEEPCGPRIFTENVLWLRLRSHPGPAFFFGIALQTPGDPAWEAAFEQIKPWLPVASLALDHALLHARHLDTPPNRTTQEDHTFPVDDFVCASPSMMAVVRQVQRAAASHSPLLITGERGAGKTSVARLLHAMSPRSDGPFVVFDGAGPAEHVTPARLFDPEAGALAAASGGTLFINAVDRLPLDMQRTLLQCIELGEIPATGKHEPQVCNARLVGATSHTFTAYEHDGQLLDRLAHRLRVLTILVPPLRERREDIPALARHFIERLRPQDMPRPTLTSSALTALMQYDWPGNVRQLRNEIEYALAEVRSEPAPLIDAKDLSPTVRTAAEALLPSMAQPVQAATSEPNFDLDQVLSDTERALIERVLAAHDGQVAAASQALGLTRQGLYKKIKRLSIDAARFQHDPVESD